MSRKSETRCPYCVQQKSITYGAPYMNIKADIPVQKAAGLDGFTAHFMIIQCPECKEILVKEK